MESEVSAHWEAQDFGGKGDHPAGLLVPVQTSYQSKRDLETTKRMESIIDVAHSENRNEMPEDKYEGMDEVSLREELVRANMENDVLKAAREGYIQQYQEMSVWMGNHPSREEVIQILFGSEDASQGQGSRGLQPDPMPEELEPSRIRERLEPEVTSTKGPSGMGARIEPEVTSTEGVRGRMSPQVSRLSRL